IIANRRGFIRRLSLASWSHAAAKRPMALIFRIKNDRTMTRTAAFNFSWNVLPECNLRPVRDSCYLIPAAFFRTIAVSRPPISSQRNGGSRRLNTMRDHLGVRDRAILDER